MSDLPVPADAIPALSVGPFTATPTGLLPTKQRVSYEIWEAYGRGLQRVQKAVHWVVGDWLNYGERAYGEKYSQALEATSFEYQTLNRDRWVAQEIEFIRRRINLSHAHHIEVAALESDEQDYWLAEAEREKWTVRELRATLRKAHRKQSPPLPPDKYRVIYADPPWQYRNTGFDAAAEKQYSTLSTPEICEYKDKNGRTVNDLTTDGSVLFLWVTNPMVPDGLEVIKAWGFEYKTNFCWVKERLIGSMAFYAFGQHELLMVATRGSALPKVDSLHSTALDTPRRRHSEKPKEMYDIIQAMYDGPYLELFARDTREGWTSWGDEIEGQDQGCSERDATVRL